MPKKIRRILVAIGELQHAPINELRKAAALAKASGATVELFHVIGVPESGVTGRHARSEDELDRYMAAVAAQRRRRLEQCARLSFLDGRHVKCLAVWDYPPHEAIVRRALAVRADLVVAATRRHHLGERLLLNYTDWELIRHCPVPLLLVKSRRDYRNAVVMAAVDPFHARARAAGLDTRLLQMGGVFARLLHGTVHIFHAYMPLVSVAPMPAGALPLFAPLPEAETVHGRQIARAIDELAETAGIPYARRHVQMGDGAGELRASAKKAHASLVVMGAVSRSALARLFIGNTAEHILDKLDCDVLVVKPRGFGKAAEKRHRAVTTLLRPVRAFVQGRRSGFTVLTI
jgi:universal stress protein E